MNLKKNDKKRRYLHDLRNKVEIKAVFFIKPFLEISTDNNAVNQKYHKN